jgi:hypothetical protein
MPVMELPISIPDIGIKYLGLNHGLKPITTMMKYRRQVTVPVTIEIAIIFFN